MGPPHVPKSVHSQVNFNILWSLKLKRCIIEVKWKLIWWEQMYISGVHIHGLYVWYDTYTSAYVCSCAHALHNLFIDRRAHCTDMCAQRWLHQALLAPLTSSDKVDVCLWISGHHPYTLKQLKCARIPHPYSYKSLCLNLLLWSHIAFLGVWNSTETHQPSFETCVLSLNPQLRI